MNDHTMMNTMTIEANARALRAAYVRDMFTALVARLRGTRTVKAGNAHA